MSSTSGFQEVQLAVYDLSRGMARSLSAQFLGQNHAIDIIPHTGVLVFGKEYYFGGTGPDTNGGGITMASSPYQFQLSHGIQPIQTIALGHTSVSQQEFESWCQSMMNNGTYAGYNYNLIQRNCNNFSHDAALKGLKLSKGVPDWILEVPNRFISSPMGQMIRPMLEQMQITGPSGGGQGMNGGVSTRLSNQGLNKNDGTLPDGSNLHMDNPWVGMGTSTSENSIATTNINLSAASTNDSLDDSHPSPKKIKIEQLTTPILDAHSQPLLSKDTNVVKICIQKLKQLHCFDEIELSSIGVTIGQKYNHHYEILNDVEQILLTKSNGKHQGEKEGQKQLEEQKVMNALSSACSLFLSPFHVENQDQQQQHRYSSAKLYILMLLRLIVLQPKLKEDMCQSILENISQFLAMIETDNISNNQNHQLEKRKSSLRSMSWCVLSNAIGSWYCTSTISLKNKEGMKILNDSSFAQNLVDLAIIDASKVEEGEENTVEKSQNIKSAEVRQCACAFLYNFTLFMSLVVKDGNNIANDNDAPVIPDIIVAILCGVAEGLTEDKDSLCLMRRLLVIGKILVTNESGKKGEMSSNPVASLLVDIGYLDTLVSLTEKKAGLSETHLLAKEIVDVINVIV